MTLYLFALLIGVIAGLRAHRAARFRISSGPAS